MVDWIIRTRSKDAAAAASDETRYPDFNAFLDALHDVDTGRVHVEIKADGASAQQRRIIKDLGFGPAFWK